MERSGLQHDSLKQGWHPLFRIDEIDEIVGYKLPTMEKIIAKAEPVTPKSILIASIIMKNKASGSNADEGYANKSASPSPLSMQVAGKPVSKARAMLERIREKERLRAVEEQNNPKMTLAQIKRRSSISRLTKIASCLAL